MCNKSQTYKKVIRFKKDRRTCGYMQSKGMLYGSLESGMQKKDEKDAKDEKVISTFGIDRHTL